MGSLNQHLYSTAGMVCTLLVCRLPSSVATTIAVLIFLLCLGRPGDCAEDCPLVTNGRLANCTRVITNTLQYTNEQLSQSCKQSQLQQTAQCLKTIVEECQEMKAVDPQHIAQLRNTTRTFQKHFDKMCAEFLELHHSASSTSETGGARQCRATAGTGFTCFLLLTFYAVCVWGASR